MRVGRAAYRFLRADLEEFLIEILGMELNRDKTEHGPAVIFVGIKIEVRDGEVVCTITPERLRKLLWWIRDHIDRGEMTQGEAASLHGRLSWATSGLYGRFGRAMLHNIIRRQESKTLFQSGVLNQDIVRDHLVPESPKNGS